MMQLNKQHINIKTTIQNSPHITTTTTLYSPRPRTPTIGRTLSVTTCTVLEAVPTTTTATQQKIGGGGGAFVVDERRYMGLQREFDNRYELQQQIGSFGVVYSAVDRDTLEEVAVKVLPKQREGVSPITIQYKIRQEIENFQAVQDCQSVARLHGCYEDAHRVYMVQELCIGGDLKELVQDNGPLSEEEAAQCMVQILSAIKSCHDMNMCYGDVKPANFLVKNIYPSPVYQSGATKNKGKLIVKAVDFGCSQRLPSYQNLTRRTGTPLYMAPEMFMRDYRNEVDNWAAGVLLFQLLTDRPPFWDNWEDLRNANNSTLMLHIMTNSINFKNLNASDEAKDLISRLLDKVPGSRMTAEEALQHEWIQKYAGDAVEALTGSKQLQTTLQNATSNTNVKQNAFGEVGVYNNVVLPPAGFAVKRIESTDPELLTA